MLIKTPLNILSRLVRDTLCCENYPPLFCLPHPSFRTSSHLSDAMSIVFKFIRSTHSRTRFFIVMFDHLCVLPFLFPYLAPLCFRRNGEAWPSRERTKTISILQTWVGIDKSILANDSPAWKTNRIFVGTLAQHSWAQHLPKLFLSIYFLSLSLLIRFHIE